MSPSQAGGGYTPPKVCSSSGGVYPSQATRPGCSSGGEGIPPLACSIAPTAAAGRYAPPAFMSQPLQRFGSTAAVRGVYPPGVQANCSGMGYTPPWTQSPAAAAAVGETPVY